MDYRSDNIVITLDTIIINLHALAKWRSLKIVNVIFLESDKRIDFPESTIRIQVQKRMIIFDSISNSSDMRNELHVDVISVRTGYDFGSQGLMVLQMQQICLLRYPDFNRENIFDHVQSVSNL